MEYLYAFNHAFLEKVILPQLANVYDCNHIVISLICIMDIYLKGYIQLTYTYCSDIIYFMHLQMCYLCVRAD